MWTLDLRAASFHPCNPKSAIANPKSERWAGEDSNLRRQSRQIYSLLRLATSLPTHEGVRIQRTATAAARSIRLPIAIQNFRAGKVAPGGVEFQMKRSGTSVLPYGPSPSWFFLKDGAHKLESTIHLEITGDFISDIRFPDDLYQIFFCLLAERRLLVSLQPSQWSFNDCRRKRKLFSIRERLDQDKVLHTPPRRKSMPSTSVSSGSGFNRRACGPHGTDERGVGGCNCSS